MFMYFRCAIPTSMLGTFQHGLELVS